ncbi:beta-ketoacyl synthase N-terminal-like domain-containing protein [Streptomyces sp. NPDC048281]|uniref:beta-ketoacyl synthase N-terminal-like domain-containing protein n=1 Tax=Streptomyces sp. NPDC048281 TaxID=3154715 RepID=UPI003437D440
MMFEPIAIVGRGCVLPDALSPERLWQNIAGGRVSITPPPSGRWRLPDEALPGLVGPAPAPARNAVGGYVSGFDEVFDPGGLRIDEAEISALDPVFHWALHSVRAALREAGAENGGERTGLVMGNLSLPTDGMVTYAEHTWFASQPRRIRDAVRCADPVPRDPTAANRFSSAMPAHLTATALGLQAGAFALDAACASSLFAVKLACDRLHDRTADLMVAGAVNRVDDLIGHISFTALGALSPTGRSRPFHRDADGLVPAEGAAFVALARLSDALASGLRVFGVIRGVGLSNDGRGTGLLVPSAEGQVRAFRQAYMEAAIDPSTVSLLECHATGTSLGDAVEVAAAAAVFGDARDLPVGSAKSNFGHLVTAAGGAGILKVLGAFEAGIRPPTLSAQEPIDALRGTPMRVLREAEPWDGPRRAGISAFGFGGNNAHLVLDSGPADSTAALVPPGGPPSGEDIAIVAIGARVGNCDGYADFRDRLLAGTARPEPRGTYDVGIDGLRTPPADLRQALGQQVAVLEAAREAAEGLDLPRERTMVLVGMGCDVEVARQPSRVRAASWLSGIGAAHAVPQVQEAFGDLLDAAQVVGTMPNIVANRISSQLDLGGPGFTVSAEQASGIVALELGVRALRAGTADAVLVGAVDLSREPVHQQAARQMGIVAEPGDAAVVLVLKRAEDARRTGEPIIALVDTVPEADAELLVGDDTAPAGPGVRFDPVDAFGAPHAAVGLLAVACAAVALCHGVVPRAGRPADPLLCARPRATVSTRTLGAAPARVALCADTVRPWTAEPPPSLHVYSGTDARTALAAAREGREADTGPARLVVWATDPAQRVARIEAARRWLSGAGVRPEGVVFRERPVDGEIAFVYTNGSACYPHMGREMLLACPDALRRAEARSGPLRKSVGWVYDDTPARHALQQTNAAALLAQVHTRLTRDILGLEPTAALGYSSGEIGALISLGAWEDAAALMTDAETSELFTKEVAGELELVRRSWRKHGVTSGTWAAFQVSVDADTVRAVLDREPTVRLMAVNAPGLCVLGGESTACRRVLDRLGEPTALPLDYEITVHIPEVAEVKDRWRRLYDRQTSALPTIRFYSCATAMPYTVSRDAVADAITAQAVGTIDFAATVERAWHDGVRIFIEHGPQGLCTGWTRRILGDREHVAVALDSADGRGLRGTIQTVAELIAAGVAVDHRRLYEHLDTASTKPRPAVRTLSVRAHPEPVRLPDLWALPEPMPPAPHLPPVTPVIRHPHTPVPHTPARAAALTEVSATPFHLLMSTHQGLLQHHSEAHKAYLQVMAHAQQLLMSVPPAASAPTASSSSPVVFDRAQLETHAAGRVSDVFGPMFLPQDGYRRQVRMPRPPLLLVDRVTALDAEPGRFGKGVIRTETDVTEHSWFLDPAGRMPAGFAVEAGQADLMLISWMGADLRHRGERVYRLLGCDITYHGSPPVPGETLSFDIVIDDHREHGDIHLFFFHFDCRVDGELRLTVRNAQAGFFGDEQLAGTGGILWDPSNDVPAPSPVPPVPPRSRRAFPPDLVAAFAQGRLDDCFGPDWQATRAHARTPRITDGRLRFLHEVTEFTPDGGPWGRGYLRARLPVSPEDWFFDAHFKGDPCMPGMLMFEGCLQAMSFYMAALGHTLDADGWRFEPVTDTPMRMRCRGQVTPLSREIVYELFVAEVASDPVPTLIADVLITVDGKKAFHGRRVGLRLVPPG